MMLHADAMPAKKPNNVSYSRVWALFLELTDKNIKISIGELRVLPFNTVVFHIEP
jgi:hypothetical protein